MMSEAVIHLTLDMHNSSHHTKLHSITAKYFNFFLFGYTWPYDRSKIEHTATGEVQLLSPLLGSLGIDDEWQDEDGRK